MNNITLVSYQDRLQDTFEISSFLSSLSCEVNLISQSEFFDNKHACKRHDNILHVFSQAELASPEVRHKLSEKLSEQDTRNDFALLTSHSPVRDNAFLGLFCDLFFWPCNQQEIAYRLGRSEPRRENKQNAASDELISTFKSFHLVGSTSVFLQALSLIKQVSRFDAPVLIQGETGTGKENAARAIHHLSKRAQNAFVPVNCATLPDELFESELFGHVKGAFTDAKHNQVGLVEIAKGGTLFLDEVDSLSHKAQAALLRFLQTQEYRKLGSNQFSQADVRIIAASNADFCQSMEKQTFRSDLFFRLDVLNITLPPLRDRLDDIPSIAHSLIRKFSREYNCPEKKLTPYALNWLRAQAWHGNVRELENTLLREMLLSNSSDINFSTDPIPEEQHSAAVPLHLANLGFQEAKQIAVANFEKHYLESLMAKTEGNVSEASRLCGKERRAIGKMLKKHKIDRRSYESE
ncbi:DNA-binding transcriptional response regulator, NtrC family, contains REC, AAA-type ATPase, and a Fis-type DNA-binding domains [Alteromonadaceae bacterium Bs31]|nr:DNA-binding transcriptional response regulator, NtrC family, contains REC, AAA-type ATPase, and a Fis-type DNA-binding domains [Alteromonadaceae bacterium Bs31]